MLRLLAYFLSFLLSQILSGAIVMLYCMTIKGMSASQASAQISQENASLLGVAMLVVDLALIVLFFVVRLVRRHCLRNTADASTWGYTLVGMLALGLGLSFISAPLHLDDGGTTAMFNGMRHNVFALLSITIVGPLFEELICREGIQRTLREKGFRAWQAIGVSALLFAVAHGNLFQGISAFVAGFYLGWLYERSRTVLLSVGAHILNNTFSIALFFLPTPLEESLPPTFAVPLGIGLLILTAICAWRVKAQK